MELEDLRRDAPVYYSHTVDSTNTRIKQLAAQGAPDKTVFIASVQTAGKGRKGRTFTSPVGGLYMSMLLRPDRPAEAALSFMPSAAVAVSRALEEVCGIRCGIKWPNDLVLDGKKVCGILTEASSDSTGLYMVLGVGINVNAVEFPPDLSASATSLYLHSGRKTELDALTRQLISGLDFMYGRWKKDGSAFLEEYRALCVNCGRDVLVADRPAKALSVGEDFSLLVEYPDGTRENISFGEVSVRGLYGYV